MARVTIEDCLDKVSNRFALVHLAVKRTMQIRRGMDVLVDHPKNKEAVLALREIAANRVAFDRDIDAILRARAHERYGSDS